MKSEPHDSKTSENPRSFFRKLRRGFAIYVLIPYLSVTVIFAVFQRKLIYRPTVSDDLSLQAVGENAESGRDVELQTPDGETLRGWLLSAQQQTGEPDSRNPLVVYFPGNSLNRYERIADLKEVTRCGCDVLIFDYRGFGDSTGSPSETGLTADARLIWKYATEDLEYDERTIVIFGESIGGAVALSLWTDENSHPPQPAALILNSTFTSLPETVAWHYPYFPFQYLLLDRWPSVERVSRVRSPIRIFHGSNDQFVPVAHAEQLADAAPEARFRKIFGAGHNDVPIYQLREELEAVRAGFAE